MKIKLYVYKTRKIWTRYTLRKFILYGYLIKQGTEYECHCIGATMNRTVSLYEAQRSSECKTRNIPLILKVPFSCRLSIWTTH